MSPDVYKGGAGARSHVDARRWRWSCAIAKRGELAIAPREQCALFLGSREVVVRYRGQLGLTSHRGWHGRVFVR